MKNKIENTDQLRKEIKRLEALKNQQELIIKQDVYEIKESLKPINILHQFINSILNKNHSNDMPHSAISLFLISLIEKILPNLFSKFEDKVDPLVHSISEKLSNFFNKK
jgi:hypothetical protein